MVSAFRADSPIMPPAQDRGLLRNAAPGLAVTLGVAVAAGLLVFGLQQLPPPVGRWPVGMMLVAILMGLALSGAAAGRPTWSPGLALASGGLLKFAVALIGLQLSLFELGQLGVRALPLAAATTLLGLALALWLTRRFGSGPRLGALLAVGTAICGASAIAAAAPGMRARAEETSYAVACIALIGLIATVLYPPMLEHLIADPQRIGLVLGSAIHDTAQVTASAVMHEQISGSDATVTAATVSKLIRNAAMLLLIPAVVWMVSRRNEPGAAGVAPPLFILAFIALSFVRSMGDAWLGPEHPAWEMLIDASTQISRLVFAMAMAALAMAVRPAHLRAIGWRPAVAAGLAAVAMLGLAIIWVW
ncbi:putative sulfate exporter family transporter [Wenzhouxiangella sp. AB-CW3]|uniref:YeiH family protein n=1 Tax=Wenzhouxiangella sp. AB-CW3 TaxID=2771012 RepID=UPI00168BBFB6|nr:putative sulfate exporter family transporter [Wenzhouxiangella sp. AB-CW3]QOC23456.1 putative sulfate exporter family transporter [Wenzhouxiangella sp. AB-CW3]